MSRYAGTTDVPHFVYRCFAEDGTLLYVGCTNNVDRRMSEHRQYPWAAAVARVETEGPYPYALGRRIEADAIQAEDPQHNANAPTASRNHRQHTWLFNSVFRAAVEHGETTSDAARLDRRGITVGWLFGDPRKAVDRAHSWGGDSDV